VSRAAVGRVFLVRNNLSFVIQLEAGRTEVVAELVADELTRRSITPFRLKRACLDEGAAPCVVHHMQRLARQSDRIGTDGPPVLAEDLEAADVETLFGKTRRLLPHFAHALA